MLEVFKTIFLIALYTVGIVIALSLIVNLIRQPFVERKKQQELNKAKENIGKFLNDLASELTEALLEADETKNKKKNTKK